MTGNPLQPSPFVRRTALRTAQLLPLILASGLALGQGGGAQPAAPASATTAPAAAAADNANSIGEFYGPVKPAETLWSIAMRMRPDKSVVTEQVLVALYRANPRAFEGSINSLAKGAVLRVPSRDEITVLNADQARAELRRLWSPGAATSDTGHPLIDPLQIAPPPPAGQPVTADAVSTDQAPAPAAVPAAVPEAPPAAAEAAPGPVTEAPPVTSEPAAAVPAAKPQAAAPNPPATTPTGQAQSLLWPLVLLLALLALLVQVLRSRKRRRARGEAKLQETARLLSPQFSVPMPAPEPEPEVAVPVAASAPSPPPPPPLPPEPEPEMPEPAEPAASVPLAADPISSDEIGTKLDLARAYVEMGEKLLARVLLREVLQQGDAAQRADAEALLGRLN